MKEEGDGIAGLRTVSCHDEILVWYKDVVFAVTSSFDIPLRGFRVELR